MRDNSNDPPAEHCGGEHVVNTFGENFPIGAIFSSIFVWPFEDKFQSEIFDNSQFQTTVNQIWVKK